MAFECLSNDITDYKKRKYNSHLFSNSLALPSNNNSYEKVMLG